MTARRRLAAAPALLAFASAACAGAAAAPRPTPTPPTLRNVLEKRLPPGPEHTEFIVEVNKKGQVTRVRSGKPSKDPTFNAMTYGNALQVFVRTASGKAVAGTFRLSYDYSPKTQQVARNVELVRAGGVDANAPGAVDQMAEMLRKRAEHDAAARAAKARASSSPLPDLKSITSPKP